MKCNDEMTEALLGVELDRLCARERAILDELRKRHGAIATDMIDRAVAESVRGLLSATLDTPEAVEDRLNDHERGDSTREEYDTAITDCLRDWTAPTAAEGAGKEESKALTIRDRVAHFKCAFTGRDNG